jgi:hypothetical protein
VASAHAGSRQAPTGIVRAAAPGAYLFLPVDGILQHFLQ